MNELDEIRGVNADEPRAGAHRIATARERLMATIAEEQASPVPRRKHRKVRVASWTTAGIAAAAAAVVVLVGTTQTPTAPPAAGPKPGHTAPPNNAAFVLNEAADHAIHQQDEPIHPGQYRYVAERISAVSVSMSRDGGPATFAWREMDTETTWVPYDEKGIWTKDMERVGPPVVIADNGATELDREIMATPRFPTGRMTARCGSFFIKSADPCHREEPSKESLPSTVKKLPRDADKWLSKFGNDPFTALQVCDAWLRSGFVPKDVRAAMYRALAKVPGIEITDDFANLDGRKGVAFGGHTAGYRTDIIIDPRTGPDIGTRIVDDGSMGLPKGTVHDSSSVVTGVVDRVGQVPGH